MRRAWGVPGILLLGTLLAACGSKGTKTNTDPINPGDKTDAGEKPPAPPPVQAGAFTHYLLANGLPAYTKDEGGIVSGILDVSGDEAGNIWVAGGDGLYLLRKGENGFEKFTAEDGLQDYTILSVAGLGPDEAMVGYQGVFGGMEDNDPEEMLKSGGADRVSVSGGTLSATHYVIGTPPGTGFPNGRYKIRSVFTIRAVYDGPYAGDIWFGGNHGVGMWNAAEGAIIEYRYVAIEGPTFMAGDHFGIAFDAVGDVWIGGAHRVGKLQYATNGGDFFAPIDPVLDVWPDADDVNRTDDHVRALAVDTSGKVWIGSLTNGLASYDPAAGTCAFYTEADGLPGTAIASVAADPDGSIWVGTHTGLGRLDPETGGWTIMRHLTEARLPTDEIMSVQIDTRTTPRTVYIGTLQGVSVYNGE